MRILLSLFLLLYVFCGQGWAWQSAQAGLHWQGFRLPVSSEEATPGAQKEDAAASPILLGVTIIPPHDMYFYGPDSKDGLPTKVEVRYAPVSPFSVKPEPGSNAYLSLLHEKGSLLEPLLPAATLKRETRFSSVALPGVNDSGTPIFPGPVTFWVTVPAIAPFYNSAAVEVSVSGLLCSASSCAPFDSKLALTLDLEAVKNFSAASAQSWWKEWENGIAVQLSVPESLGMPDSSVAGEGENPFQSSRAGGLGGASRTAGESSGLPLNPIRTEAQKAFEKYASVFSTLSPSYFNPHLEVSDLGGAVFFGLLAGLLLNLMPCVLPVVSLKFTALMAVSAMEDKKERARSFRVHCLIFASGILAWFLILAFLLGSAGWAWGQIFQSPQVIVILALVMFLLGLSLFGVYTLPILDLRVSSDKHPHLQSFASGLLATLLATPCSGPLLGGVLGWALRQPLPVLMLAVGSVGAGMALPYFVLALSPNMVHLLPRPGRWTLRLEQLLGFFLMGSVVYMVTLLPSDWVPAFLFNMLSIAVAAWLWGQIGHLGAGRVRRALSRIFAVVLVGLSIWWGALSIQRDFFWENFDPEVFSEDLGKENMLLEFTADWCPSCKAMEHTTLNKNRMGRLRDKYGMRTIRVDMTRDDPVAKELLMSLGSGSIPVIALFPKGENATQPLVLRDIVTPAQLKEALSKTF